MFFLAFLQNKYQLFVSNSSRYIFKLYAMLTFNLTTTMAVEHQREEKPHSSCELVLSAPRQNFLKTYTSEPELITVSVARST